MSSIDIPVYYKQKANESRPTDSEFYWVTGSGIFFCRNHHWFQSDVPVQRLPQLPAHQASIQLNYPRLPAGTLEQAVGFFAAIYKEHHSEAIVTLYWDLLKQEYVLVAPEQYITKYNSVGFHSYTSMDINYQATTPPSPQCLLVGDIHSHGNMLAFHSGTDSADETYSDGLHFVIGKIAQEPPDIKLYVAVDGRHFPWDWQQLANYSQRSDFPAEWLSKFSVKEETRSMIKTYYGGQLDDDDWFQWKNDNYYLGS